MNKQITIINMLRKNMRVGMGVGEVIIETHVYFEQKKYGYLEVFDSTKEV